MSSEDNADAAAPDPENASPDADGGDTEDANVDDWFRPSDDVRVGRASGNTFELRPVIYAVLDDMAIMEGDIALGSVEEMEQIASAVADDISIPLSGIAISGERFRWPGGIIPFVIEADMPQGEQVMAAIAHWHAQTPIRFVPRDPAEPAHENYLSFEARDGCWSQVGMRGGKQVVSIGADCGTGQAIHEIGHAVGLWHEHSRGDRDAFIEILWENIRPGHEHNFTQRITDGDDIGGYDLDSIMHYPALAFSKNGQPTIIPREGGVIGQREGLSALDIAAVIAMYPDLAVTEPPRPQFGRGSTTLGVLSAFDARRWTTRGWPIDRTVSWSIMPTVVSARIEWNLTIERESERQLTYYLFVRNLSDIETTIEATYVLL